MLARKLRVSRSLVYKWGEPNCDDADSGAINPIDRLDDIFDDALIHAPQAAQAIACRYSTRLELFQSGHCFSKPETLEELITTATSAIATYAGGANPDEAEKALIELRAAIDAALCELKGSDERQEKAG